MFFATALWAYTSLNEEYRTNISIPLKFNLPANRAFDASPPENLTISIKGSGWQIFNLFFNSSAQCYIDLSSAMINDTVYDVTRDKILKGIQYLNSVQPLELFPDNIRISTGLVGEYSVPIAPQVFISPKDGYTLVGDVQIKPDIAVIRGNDAIAKNIQKWMTAPAFFENVYEPINQTVALSDSLRGVIGLNIQSVRISADIQQVAEITIPDVPVKIIGGALPNNHIIEPSIVTVTLRGGINQIKEISPDNISAWLEYSRVLNDSSGIIKPNIKYPEKVNLLKISPPYLYHKVRIK
jgi:hypothetical protein